jgi:hypothetical protein
MHGQTIIKIQFSKLYEIILLSFSVSRYAMDKTFQNKNAPINKLNYDYVIKKTC